MSGYLVGIDIGGTKTAVALALRAGEGCADVKGIQDRLEFATPVGKHASQAISAICGAVDTILEKNQISLEALSAIGVSCGGPVDVRRGMILSPPNLYGWNNLPIRERLEERYHVPLRLQNDADACALAEWKYGAGRGCDNIVFLTMGTGMGAGLILNGRLYSGTTGMAGEIGHVRLSSNGPVGHGKEGSFEGFCSGGGITQIACSKALERFQQGLPVSYCASVGDLDTISAKTVSDAATAGEPDAIEVYEKVGRYLGMGISILIDILNPQKVIVGSIYQRSVDLLYDSMMRTVERETIPFCRAACSIVPAQLKNQLGDYAAIMAAQYEA